MIETIVATSVIEEESAIAAEWVIEITAATSAIVVVSLIEPAIEETLVTEAVQVIVPAIDQALA